jgi:hypothetical protein
MNKTKKFYINVLKDKIMTSGRYLEKVFETGFETYEQFHSFCNMCENHVNKCNAYCKQLKPKIPFIQRKAYKEYDNFRSGCVWSVEIINDLIANWQNNYNTAMEEAKARQQLEDRIRLEHEIAIEYQKTIYEENKENDKKSYCGFKTAVMQPKKRKYTRKKKDE